VERTTSLSKKVFKGATPDGEYSALLTGQISKQDLRLRANPRARAAYAEERERGREEGLTQGSQEGLAQGLAAAETQMHAMTQAFAGELRQVVERIALAAGRYWIESEASMRALSVEIVQKLLKSELAQSPDAIVSVVRDAVLRVANSRDVRVRVSVSDLPALRDRHDELLAGLDGVTNLEVVANSDITPGGCIVESPIGVVDATIETQIARIEDAMEKAA
jgi:flagellar assembly protein FliH